MTARQSAATDKALKLYAKGLSKAAAARKAGISWVTLWRAIKRQEKAKHSL